MLIDLHSICSVLLIVIHRITQKNVILLMKKNVILLLKYYSFTFLFICIIKSSVQFNLIQVTQLYRYFILKQWLQCDIILTEFNY